VILGYAILLAKLRQWLSITQFLLQTTRKLVKVTFFIYPWFLIDFSFFLSCFFVLYFLKSFKIITKKSTHLSGFFMFDYKKSAVFFTTQ